MSLDEGTPEVVECCGSIIRAKRSKKGFLVCPICGESIFFTAHDLLRHVVSHALGITERKHKAPRR